MCQWNANSRFMFNMANFLPCFVRASRCSQSLWVSSLLNAVAVHPNFPRAGPYDDFDESDHRNRDHRYFLTYSLLLSVAKKSSDRMATIRFSKPILAERTPDG